MSCRRKRGPNAPDGEQGKRPSWFQIIGIAALAQILPVVGIIWYASSFWAETRLLQTIQERRIARLEEFDMKAIEVQARMLDRLTTIEQKNVQQVETLNAIARSLQRGP